MSNRSSIKKGFTVVELMVVIVVISILATITYFSYVNLQTRAREAHIKAEAYTIIEAIETARNKTHTALWLITGSTWTGQYCLFQPPTAPNPGAPIPDGTDFSVQTPMTQSCWNDSLSALQKISDASGIDVTKFRDPWGRPYYIDENEFGDDGIYACSKDSIGWLSYPYKGGYQQNWPLELNVAPLYAKCYQ